MDKIQARNMLIDVVKHFSKDSKELRSLDRYGGCFYNPPENKPKCIGCAIGMYLPTRVAIKCDRYGGDDTTVDCLIEATNLLPNWIKDMDIDFLLSIQNLHDGSIYWEDTISDLGKKQVNLIINKFDLGTPYFN